MGFGNDRRSRDAARRRAIKVVGSGGLPYDLLLTTNYFFDPSMRFDRSGFDVADEECRPMAWMPWVIASDDQQLYKTDHNEECLR